MGSRLDTLREGKLIMDTTRTAAHLPTTVIALERFDAARLTFDHVSADVRAGYRRLCDQANAWQTRQLRLQKIFNALRADTGRELSSVTELLPGIRTNLSNDLARTAVLRHAHDHVTHPHDGAHILDSWCPACGSGARGAIQ